MYALDGAQTRQLIDAAQAYSAYRSAQREYVTRFKGAMAWKTVSGRQYLYRKVDGAWKGIGPRSSETELAYDRFKAGRSAVKARRKSIGEQLQRMASVNRAMRLGRMPATSARILRKLDDFGLLGSGLRVAGTHALYAYEMMAGAYFDAAYVATADIDLLLDTRSRLKLIAPEMRDGGLMALLTKIDPSFAPTEAGSFRAANGKGFLVDLITPATRSPVLAPAASPIGKGGGEDLRPVEIAGLAWLESSPAVEQIVIDESGFPVVVIAPDPRAFTIHKLWLSGRDDREPVKRRRDAAQARAVAAMIAEFLPHLSFDDPALPAMPEGLRVAARALVSSLQPRDSGPDWQ